MIGPLALVVSLGALYGLPRRWPLRYSAAWFGGVAVLAFALLAPLDGTLSAHMAQHLLLGLVAPLLLALGAPGRLATRRGFARVLHAIPLRPWNGWLIWTAVMVGTHFTGVYELALRDPFVHVLEHLAYLVSGLCFWIPLVAVDPLPHPPGPAARLVWLLAAMPPMGLVGAKLLSNAVAYPSYPDLADQRTAAGLMWGAGSLLMSVALVAIVFSALLREEARQRRRELVR
jgi:putative membrane protein